MRRQRASGFTLLEVMIAMAIMAVAFGAILTSQSGAIRQAITAKELNTAGWLAHRAMVEAEHLTEGKPFDELDKEQDGQFKEPFQNYSWKREVRELKFPDLTQPSKEGEGVPETARIMGKVITKYLNTAMRELVVTVSWKRGKSEQSVKLTTYLIDLNAEFNFQI